MRNTPDDSVDSSSTTDRPLGPDARGGAATVLRSGSVLAGRFTLLDELGSGGIGRVFAAVDRELGGRVAVKVLRPELVDPESLERLRREVRVARTPHPSLVRVFDLHRHGELHFLSMELVDGESLRDRLRRDGPLGVETAEAIGRQVAAALAHLHGLGVVHRDVKPGNVLLASSGEVKLCDLGLARPLASGITVTAAELVVGTPAYMAPEQASGQTLTPETDIYALGLTLVETISGKVPLAESSPLATLDRRRRERLEPLRRSLPECPGWLDRLFRAMLEPRPGDRPSAATVVRALEQRRLGPRLTRRVLRLVAAAAAAAVAVVGAVLGTLALLEHRPARFDVTTGEVRGLDHDGKVVWRRAIEGEVVSTARGDLDGDGVDELVVGTVASLEMMVRDPERPSSNVVVFELAGEVMTSIRVENELTMWTVEYSKAVTPRVSILDLEGDGRGEVVVVANHVGFFPSGVVVYWPSDDVWEQVLYNSGLITAVAAAPAEGRARLRFAAVNNRLGFVTVVGELEVRAGDRTVVDVPNVVLASPEAGPFTEVVRGRWRFYTPLVAECSGPQRSPVDLRVLPDGGSTVVDRCGTRRIDRLGNPLPGATAGLDLGVARFTLLGRAAEECWRSWQPDGTASLEGYRALAATAGSLLEEPGTRLGFELFRSRSLARTGNLEGAIAGLEDLCAAIPSEDAVYRLAHLEAIAGRYPAAIARLGPVSSQPATSRGEYDATQLLIRLAAAIRDRGLASVVIPRLALSYSERNFSSGLSGALWARVQLWWDEPTAADEQVRAWAFEPAGDAIAALARWRRGHSRPDDLELLRTSLQTNPDARDEIRLAMAAARLAAGEAELAAADLQALAQELEPQAKDDFYGAQSLDLARALRTVALAASGDRARARAEAEALRSGLTPRLLPAILADEVLQGKW